MSTTVVSPIVVIDTASSNPQVTEQTPVIGVATSTAVTP